MKIKFYPSSKEVSLLVPPPKPSVFYVPRWYRDIKKFSEKDMHINETGAVDGINLKSCMPFFDGMVNGYIQETWQDIVVDNTDQRLTLSAQIVPEMIGSRGKDFHSPIGKGFYQNEFVWRSPWIPRLPKGWSALVTSPVNQVHLPFQTATGIIDSDNFYHSPFGNFPFYIKEGFRGIIPAGTPMYQIIPIKRESWKSEIMPWNEDEQSKRIFMIASKSYGAYKKLFHVRKDFR